MFRFLMENGVVAFEYRRLEILLQIEERFGRGSAGGTHLFEPAANKSIVRGPQQEVEVRGSDLPLLTHGKETPVIDSRS